jgi:putative PEP-CTERM system histidine kinase
MTMIAVAASGYFIVGVLFTLLAVLLVTSWRGHRPGVYLIAASLLNAIWGFILAWNTGRSPVAPSVIFVLEVARMTSWVVFLAYLAGQIGVSRNLRLASVALCILVMLGGVGIWVDEIWFGGSGDFGRLLFPGGLAIALIGLLLTEQLYRNSAPEVKWGLKALVLGLGGIFAYDLFLYSQAVLFNALDTSTWSARGLVNLFFVPAIAIAARRNPDWELRIFVSRQIVFYTTTLIAVGIYLLLMSLGGYLLLRFGGSWGALARIVFFAGAVLVLFILLFSSTLRSRLRVFLSKHFFHNRYDYREEWMRLIGTLAEFEQSSTREVVVKAVAQIVGSPTGLLWVYKQSEGIFQLDACYEYDGAAPDLETDDALLGFILKDGWIVDLAEFDRDPSVYADLEVPDWVRRLSNPWLFVPLMFGKELLGLIMLTKTPGPPKLNYEDRDLLKTVGNHVAVHLAQMRSDRLLTEAQQFETYNKLTAFLMHDLNNLIAQQSLIVTNAEKHKRNPEFIDDAISTIAGSVERMRRVMRQLKHGNADSKIKLTALKFIASAAVDRCSANKPVPRLALNGVDANILVDPEEFTMVLAHLVRNAQDASASDGVVSVSLNQSDGNAIVKIADNGAGMTAEFIRDRLFRPFDSTKGTQGMGIGAYQARAFVRKLGGELNVESVPGEGTTISMTLPLSASGP